MDHSRFQEAQRAYEAGDYRTAAKGFLASAGRGPDGNGAAYHKAGNALMRLRRHQDAVTVYGHALRDPIYECRGAVWANLGAAYIALGEYAEAVKSYESALAEPDYTTHFRAYQGMAGALLERGRIEEAAIAYRKAALDPVNPEPGKALVNLGLCFMALGRPQDAVEAYQAALGFDGYKGRGKALANLGQAYVVLGEYEEAVKSFEKSTQLHGHELPPAAEAAFETARAQAKTTKREVVEGLDTGEVAAVGLPEAPAITDWETAEFFSTTEMASVAAAGAGESSGWAAESLSLAPFDHPSPDAGLSIGDDEAVADFFSVTEEELKQRDREARRAARHVRGPGAVWRTVGVVSVCVVLVIGLFVGAYEMGFGWPTQSQSVAGMLSAYQSGGAVDGYWVAVPSKDVSKEMAKIPPLQSYTIDQVGRGPQTSTVSITVTPKNGSPLHYTVTLSREGVAWKVNGIDNDWRSTGG